MRHLETLDMRLPYFLIGLYTYFPTSRPDKLSTAGIQIQAVYLAFSLLRYIASVFIVSLPLLTLSSA